MEACGDTDVHIVGYAWRKLRWTNRTIKQLVSLRTAEIEQLRQGKRMIGGRRRHVVLDLFSSLNMGKIQKFLR